MSLILINQAGRDVSKSGGDVPTEAPTILLANRNRPVVQPTGPLAIRPAYISSYVILHCLVNGLPLGQIAGNSPAPVEKQMLDNDQVCRVPATQLIIYLFRIPYARF